MKSKVAAKKWQLGCFGLDIILARCIVFVSVICLDFIKVSGVWLCLSDSDHVLWTFFMCIIIVHREAPVFDYNFMPFVDFENFWVNRHESYGKNFDI